MERVRSRFRGGTAAVMGALLLAATGAGAAGGAPPGAGSDALLRVADVRQGMRGVARTVVQGTRVETFDVQVLGVLRRAGPAGDLVLIRASGPVIDRTGGIAAGMSGSPVYVDGRLLGAIGYGWSFADHRLGLVTPIHDMLAATQTSRGPSGTAASGLPKPLTVGGRTFAPVAVPLLMTGMGPRAAEALASVLRPYGVVPVTGGSNAHLGTDAPLGPGSALGVQLMRGDVNLTAVGTVTYRRGSVLVAFGHPFLNKGGVEYMLTPAVIHQVVRSVAIPFKVGSAGALVGTIRQDRRAAVAGELGVIPQTFAIRVRVFDEDRQREVRLGMRVVRDAELAPTLALLGALEAFDRALDRVGGGTARLRMTLRGAGLPGPMIRSNVYYHARDVSLGALLELPEALRLVFRNEFVAVEPTDLLIEAQVGRHRATAGIVEVTPAQTHVRAGESLAVSVTLRPFHGEPVTRILEVAVPDQYPAGPVLLVVRGGAEGAAGGIEPAALLNLLQGDAGDSTARSLAEQLAAFENRDQNTQVVAELVNTRLAPDRALRAKARQSTPWVVRGRQQFLITVER